MLSMLQMHTRCQNFNIRWRMYFYFHLINFSCTEDPLAESGRCCTCKCKCRCIPCWITFVRKLWTCCYCVFPCCHCCQPARDREHIARKRRPRWPDNFSDDETLETSVSFTSVESLPQTASRRKSIRRNKDFGKKESTGILQTKQPSARDPEINNNSVKKWASG